MPTPVSLRCPHCQAPLPPATDPTRVRCEYCGHVSQLQRTIAPHQGLQAPQKLQSAHIEVAYDVTRRVRMIVGVVLVSIALAIGGVVAFVVIKSINRATEVQSHVQSRASQIQREALDRAAEAQREAFEQLDRALADDPEARAKARAEVAKAKARAMAEARGERRAQKKLPKRPDPTSVVQALRDLDLSDCPGPARVTYGVVVSSRGRVRTTSASEIHAPSGDALGCIRSAIESLELPRSRRGFELEFKFEIE